jgi:hypothetical protein
MSAVAKVILTAQDLTGPAFRSASSGLEKFSDTAAMARNALATLGVGFSVAAVTGYVRNIATAGAETQRLATLVNTSAERFQAEAYAVRAAGIDQAKYADILKDVNEKVGQFMRGEGGEMAAFFENIAPKVGVTADQFRNLSGPDALQLYVNTLQKAGLSHTEMTSAMEDLASDSTLLLPLLRDNGKAMNDLAKEAQNVGAVLDNEAIKAAEKFNGELTKLEVTASSFGRSVAIPIVQGLNHVIDQFRLARQFSDGWLDSLSRTGTSNPEERIKSIGEKIKQLNKDLENPNLVGLPRSRTEQNLRAAEKDLRMLQEFRRPALVESVTYGPDDQRSNEARKLGLQAPTRVPKEEEESKKGSKKSKNGSSLKPPAPPKTDPLGDFIAGEQVQAAIQRDTEAAAAAKTLYETTRTGIEKLGAEEVKLQRLKDQNYISDDVYWRAREAAIDSYEASLEKAGQIVETNTDQATAQADRLGAAFAQTFDRMFTDGMKFGDLLKKLAFDAINIAFLTPATQRLGSGLASAATALFTSFDGGGYTGAGARSGGLDGRGGFMAMLHPQETVVDHTRGQSAGGSTIVQNISIDARGADAGVEQRIRAAMAQTKNETLAAVQARANRGGSFAAALGRA